jgi:uncharacterized protein YdaT
MATPKRDVHVVPNHSKGKLDWSVKRESAKRTTQTFENKSDAMERARQIAINSKVEVVEHRKDGIITGSNSYGNDPRKSRG